MFETLSIGLIGAAGGTAVLLIVLVALAKSYRFICSPNEVLIFSGRKHKLEDGREVGFRVISGGGSWRIPVIERVERMDMTEMEIQLSVQNAYSGGSIPLSVAAVANVKIASDRTVLANAIERFLGRSRSEIQSVARETLEGHLRGVLATLTPEEVNEDRLKFAESLREEVEEDFVQLGLHMDTLKIQHVSDEKGYLDSIGRKEIAVVLQKAEIAESNARNDAKKVEAEAKQLGEVAREQASTAIVQKKNALRQIQADLDAKAMIEEERAKAAANQARAEAEQVLQQVRAEVETKRLMADVIVPAEAERNARELVAKGEAAPIQEKGRAQAEAMKMISQAWVAAGDDARDIYLIQQLEDLVRIVVQSVNNIEVGHVELLDGGDGAALPSYVRSFPATVAAVLKELKGSTGIDIPGLLAGGMNGAPPTGGGKRLPATAG